MYPKCPKKESSWAPGGVGQVGGRQKRKFTLTVPVPVDSVNLVLSYLSGFRCQNDAGKGKKAFKEKCIHKEGKEMCLFL